MTSAYVVFEWVITVGLLLAAAIPLYWSIAKAYGIKLRTRRRKQQGNFDPKSKDYLRRREKAYPPPYPNGWFKLCDVDDLDNGNIVSVSALGRDYVVFRARLSGAIGVLDAHCPHLGAHLGQGGTVEGDCIQCPFHAWRIGTDGVTASIPYSTAPPPAAARTKAHRHTVWQGMVFVWFHAEGDEPEYELEALPQIAGWKRLGTASSVFHIHITDMAENSADYFHFNYLHAPMPIPLVGRLFTTKFDTKLFFPEEKHRNHICYFDNFATVQFLGKHPLQFTKQKTCVTFEGPSVVHFSIMTPIGGLHLIKTLLPRKPFEIYNEDTWFVEPKMNTVIARLIISVAKGALEQDRVVWENRVYNPKPCLVLGDGPFPAHRKWFSQFFTENSRNAAYHRTHNNELQW